MTFRKFSESFETVSSIQPVNLQMTNLKVFVNQLSQTLLIRSMYKLFLGKQIPGYTTEYCNHCCYIYPIQKQLIAVKKVHVQVKQS